MLSAQISSARLASAMILQESVNRTCECFGVEEPLRIFEIEFITAENESLMSLKTRVVKEEFLRVLITLVYKHYLIPEFQQQEIRALKFVCPEQDAENIMLFMGKAVKSNLSIFDSKWRSLLFYAFSRIYTVHKVLVLSAQHNSSLTRI